MLAEISGCDGFAGIGEAEIRVQVRRSRETSERVRVLTVGERFHSQRIFVNSLQRGRGKRLHGEALGRLRSVIAERLADGSGNLGGSGQNLVFVRRVVFDDRDLVACHGLCRLERKRVAPRLAIERARNHDS